MPKNVLIAAIVLLVSHVPAAFADIRGNWRQDSGETIHIAPCDDWFCVTLTNGDYKGVRVGRVQWNGKAYVGTVTDPSTGKTYHGAADHSGDTIQLKGCVLRILCVRQTWFRY